MNTIDQNILLPTAPSIVWDYISNLAQNPEWQVDCAHIQFLTTIQKGQGTRWRMHMEGGREIVAEITAWYDRIGYEYSLIEGAPYKENNGRLRLQEVPEGTVLQWTFHYEPTGVLGGLRNTLGLKRSIEQAMADSLWTLWRQIGQAHTPNFEAKSLMQDAPDVESRAQYKPRHRSVMEKYQEGEAPRPPQPDFSAPPQSTIAPVVIPEPPVADDDTRPRPVIADIDAMMPPLQEPDFLRSRQEPEFDRPTDPNVLVAQPTASPEALFAPPAEASAEDNRLTEISRADEAYLVNAGADEIDELGLLAPRKPASETAVSAPADERPAEHDQPVPLTDPSSRSIFEIFGVPKPSETQEIQSHAIRAALYAEEPPAGSTAPMRAAVVVLAGGRRGQRIYSRSRLVKLRRPT